MPPPPLNRLEAAKLIKSLEAKLANEANRRGVAVDLVRKHLADKICALYELYGQRGTSASTRY